MSNDLERIQKLEIEVALLKQELETEKSRNENMRGGVNRGLWIVGGGFISSFVYWIVSGGMNG